MGSRKLLAMYHNIINYGFKAIVLRLLITSFRVWLQAKTRKFHKSFKASPCSCYTKIKYLAFGLNGNVALGFALCNITISAARLVLYFTYSTRGNALTYILSVVDDFCTNIVVLLLECCLACQLYPVLPVSL